jgi:hypothetical protein
MFDIIQSFPKVVQIRTCLKIKGKDGVFFYLQEAATYKTKEMNINRRSYNKKRIIKKLTFRPFRFQKASH